MEPSRVFRLTAPELARIGEDWFPFAVHLLRGLIGTARRIEHNARQREALVALGTLAAGLAHEINNPASAAVRSVGALQQSPSATPESPRKMFPPPITRQIWTPASTASLTSPAMRSNAATSMP